jgi:hypothetical protein
VHVLFNGAGLCRRRTGRVLAQGKKVKGGGEVLISRIDKLVGEAR